MTLLRTMVVAGIFAASVVYVTKAEAALQPLPDGTVYDTTLRVTWLANANLAATQKFGLKINANGTMDYATALQWVAQLNAFNGVGYLGHNSWTLPTTPSIDSSCNAKGPNGNNFGKNSNSPLRRISNFTNMANRLQLITVVALQETTETTSSWVSKSKLAIDLLIGSRLALSTTDSFDGRTRQTFKSSPTPESLLTAQAIL